MEVIQVIFVIVMSSLAVHGDQCERDKARTVRRVIYEDLIPLYQSIGAKIPYKCPFFRDRDRFLAHEEHKERESGNRWACNYCGKAFIGEVYLDNHLANRHPQYIYQEEDSVCLADFCELFRCDVLSGMAQPSFWDVALCMEEDMMDLTEDCTELMRECIPESLSWNASKTLIASLTDSLCSFLSCKKYYDMPMILKEEEPPGTGYVVMTVLLTVALIMYYCVAVNYFWLDTFSDVYEQEDFSRGGPNTLFHDDVHEQAPHLKQTKKQANVIKAETAEKDFFNVKSGFKSVSQKSGGLKEKSAFKESGFYGNNNRAFHDDELYSYRKKGRTIPKKYMKDSKLYANVSPKPQQGSAASMDKTGDSDEQVRTKERTQTAETVGGFTEVTFQDEGVVSGRDAYNTGNQQGARDSDPELTAGLENVQKNRDHDLLGATGGAVEDISASFEER